MTKLKIQEVIIVEGRDDTTRLKEAVDCDTIETNGSALSKSTMQQIQHAMNKRGIIIFTDPDYPGERIRRKIVEVIPNAKHAFLPRHLAKDAQGKIGIEAAKTADIIQALQVVYTVDTSDTIEVISQQQLLADGLIVGHNAHAKRRRLGELLHLGDMNGKQLMKRLKMFRISLADYQQAIQIINKEDKGDDYESSTS